MNCRLFQALSVCLAAAPLSMQFAHAAMSTQGQFSVNESGAATYAIPIPLPPGIAGIAPKLALSYNSQAGNGLLGMGWSLSGLSAIGRCPQTMAQDSVRGSVKFDANDRYCLDGQRLIAVSGAYGVSGTEYRTERDGFTKIVSYGTAGNGPGSFTVWTKSGQVMEYGNTTDSRIEPQGKSMAGIWALNKLKDTKGNYFTVTYNEDNVNGDFYPQRIDYTGNANAGVAPNNSVQFTYETRPDITPLYQMGSLVKNTVRLTKVQTYAGSTLVKEHRLSYGNSATSQRSRLASVTECAADGSCFPAVSFSWNEGTNAFASWQMGDGVSTSFGISAAKLLTLADVNGDGKSDLVAVYGFPDDSSKVFVKLSQGDSFAPWQSWDSVNTNFGISAVKLLTTADVNADGKMDLVAVYRFPDDSSKVFVKLSQGDSFAPWQSWDDMNAGLGVNFGMSAVKLLTVADVNGDGRPDLVAVYGFPDDSSKVFVKLSQGDSFAPWQSWDSVNTNFGISAVKLLTTADVNADGKMDLVAVYRFPDDSSKVFVKLSQGDSFAPWQSWDDMNAGLGVNFGMSAVKLLTVADVNGDGRPDLVAVYGNADDSVRVFVKLSKGDSFTPWQQWDSENSFFGASAVKSWFAADVNGDGKTDMVAVYRYTDDSIKTFVKLSRGSSFTSWQQWDSANSSFGVSAVKFLVMGDVSGDGKADLVAVYGFPDDSSKAFVKTSLGADENISGVLNELGNSIWINYKPLTSSTVYTKDSGTNAVSYPLIDLQTPMSVVSSVHVSNGIGGTTSSTYIYGGLKFDVNRGSLGFRWVQSVQVQSGLTSRTEYRQDWPYVGLPSLTQKTMTGAGNGELLNRVTYVYGCNDFISASGCTVAAGRRYFPYVSESTETGWDLNGAALPTIITASQYDTWGNPTQITVSTGDGFSKTTNNTYTNDTTNWFLGRLTRATVTSVTP